MLWGLIYPYVLFCSTSTTSKLYTTKLNITEYYVMYNISIKVECIIHVKSNHISLQKLNLRKTRHSLATMPVLEK